MKKGLSNAELRALDMKVIFLDIDGVLNSQRSAIAFRGYPWPDTGWEKFDPVAVGLLRKALDETGAKCVLSSSWRLHLTDAQRDQLAQHLGIEIIDSTPMLSGFKTRGREIQTWLKANPDVQTWAILDDDSDMLTSQLPRFVHTNMEVGLSFRDYEQLMELLYPSQGN